MKIHIIGAGVVGLATGRGFARFGHELMYSDISDEALDRVQGEAKCYDWPEHPIPDADIHFVCVPEDVAPDVVRRLAQVKSPIVIRSSVPPGTTASLAKELNRPLWHNPEFLREATASDDFLWADHTLVGWGCQDGPGLSYSQRGLVFASSQQLSILLNLYGSMQIKVTECSSTESEMAKLLTNNYLATQISFWNQAQWLCDHLKLNSHRVARLVALDSRVSKYGAYKHGAPYGGRCLPKDVAQVLKLARELPSPVPMPLLTAVVKVNKSIGGE